jgi:hypothetical protein
MGLADQALSVAQIAQCLVRLKTAIGGTFRVVEVTTERIVLVNSRCPFGSEVQHSPSLCRMTSAVFGGIAARNIGQAAVSLEERIALGDPGCRVVIHLGYGSQSRPASPPIHRSELTMPTAPADHSSARADGLTCVASHSGRVLIDSSAPQQQASGSGFLRVPRSKWCGALRNPLDIK